MLGFSTRYPFYNYLFLSIQLLRSKDKLRIYLNQTLDPEYISQCSTAWFIITCISVNEFSSTCTLEYTQWVITWNLWYRTLGHLNLQEKNDVNGFTMVMNTHKSALCECYIFLVNWCGWISHYNNHLSYC